MKKFAIWRICGECGIPVGIIDPSEYLGHNPGHDGHLFNTEKDANSIRDIMIQEMIDNLNQDKVDYLELNTKVIGFTLDFVPLES